jgi:hypothetical protein
MAVSRRAFCSQAGALLLTPRLLLAQSEHPQTSTARPNVAAIDHDHILQAAEGYLGVAPAPLTAFPCKRSPGNAHDFYSEADDYWPDPAKPDGPYVQRNGPPNPDAFTAHRDALLHFGIQVPALAAAFVLTKEERYAEHAVRHLRAWFVDSATSMTPSLRYAQTVLPAKEGRFEGVVEAVSLAEVAQAIPFLASSEALTKNDTDALQSWFAAYLQWLNTSRLAGLARDSKNHHGSSWLLQAAAFTRLPLALSPNADDAPLSELRHRYKTITIRAQINADGVFPQELTTRNPYRLSLFNLDMLAAVCLLVSTQFDSVWEYDLQDGPGMRAAIARHFPYIKNRGAWPYPADATHFNDLPLRQPSLLFCAQAYTRPEYADLWRTLPADTEIAELQRTFPIWQPLLWVTRLRA